MEETCLKENEMADFEKLKQNVIDMLEEQQQKLG